MGVYDWIVVVFFLLVEQYIFIIYDFDLEFIGLVFVGMFVFFNSFKFGLYIFKVYIFISDGWKCVFCNGVGGMLIDSKVVVVVGVMSVIIVLSFMWFVVGFGGLMQMCL